MGLTNARPKYLFKSIPRISLVLLEHVEKGAPSILLLGYKQYLLFHKIKHNVSNFTAFVFVSSLKSGINSHKKDSTICLSGCFFFSLSIHS